MCSTYVGYGTTMRTGAASADIAIVMSDLNTYMYSLFKTYAQ